MTAPPRTTVDAPTRRAIPSRFPPIEAFANVASANDLAAVMELEGWTNDRLTAERLHRLPRAHWVWGRPNASVIMAAFLHGSPFGARFTSEHLGAWYAAFDTMTCILEIANGVRREIAVSGMAEHTGEHRIYVADLAGEFVDIRGGWPALHDPGSHQAGQAFGEAVRAGDAAGIVYDSVRRPGNACAVAFRPDLIGDPVQAEHIRLTVAPTGKVVAVRL
jgi:hypothetical protein